MKMRFACALSLALVASPSSSQSTVPAVWKSFTSDTGFSVTYPGSWIPKKASKNRLTILSSRGGAEALVIRRGQAVINVTEAKDKVDSSLPQVMDQYSRNVDVLSRRDIRNENAGSRGCRDLREIISREAAVPQENVPGSVPYIINTEYFCEVKKHIYVTSLRNFDGDKRQAIYQKIALRVAKSLRRENKVR